MICRSNRSVLSLKVKKLTSRKSNLTPMYAEQLICMDKILLANFVTFVWQLGKERALEGKGNQYLFNGGPSNNPTQVRFTVQLFQFDHKRRGRLPNLLSQFINNFEIIEKNERDQTSLLINDLHFVAQTLFQISIVYMQKAKWQSELAEILGKFFIPCCKHGNWKRLMVE